MMLIEKYEDCPNCQEIVRWNYDGQICKACGYPLHKGRILTKEEFVVMMQNAFMKNDIVRGHILADNLMCSLLEAIGYEEGVAIFRNSDRWYA